MMNMEAVDRFHKQQSLARRMQRDADFHLGRDLVENLAQHLRAKGHTRATISQMLFSDNDFDAYGGTTHSLTIFIESADGTSLGRVFKEWSEALAKEARLDHEDLCRALNAWFRRPGRKSHPFFATPTFH